MKIQEFEMLWAHRCSHFWGWSLNVGHWSLRFTYTDTEVGLYVVRFYKNGVYQDSNRQQLQQWLPLMTGVWLGSTRSRKHDIIMDDCGVCQLIHCWVLLWGHCGGRQIPHQMGPVFLCLFWEEVRVLGSNHWAPWLIQMMNGDGMWSQIFYILLLYLEKKVLQMLHVSVCSTLMCCGFSLVRW